MSQTSPQPVAHILSAKSTGLDRLIQRANALSRVDRALRDFLGEPLNQHCNLLNIKNNILMLQVDSAAWSTRIRYQTPQLLKFLRDMPGMTHLLEIKVQVRPAAGEPAASEQRRAHMSQNSAAVVRALANATDDPKLGAALRRLASRHRDRDERKP